MESITNKIASMGTAGLAMGKPVTAIASESMSNKALMRPVSSDGAPVLSTLSRQLGESAVRAETRDKTLSRAELKEEGKRLMNQIFGDAYQANKKEHNDEVPDTQDPALLARARSATEYVVKSDQHDRSVRNPFTGLSRDQLNLIVHDESGQYTINERRAAFYGVSDMESEWNRQVMRINALESGAGISNTPQFCTEILAHYRSLPAIEQAQYPDNYESRLEAQINEKPEKPKRSDRTLTLFEVLELMARPRRRGDTRSVMGEVGATVNAGNHQPVSVMKNN